MIPTQRKPTHPGDVLLNEFLKPMKMNQSELAAKLNISLQRVNTLIKGKRDMTAETAVLLARVFKTTAEFWMNLQIACDLYDANKRLAPQEGFEKAIYSILLAEPNQRLSDVLSAILTHDGFAVHTAKNSKEALRKLQASDPDLIVFDLDTSGSESSKFLEKAKSVDAHVEVLMLRDKKTVSGSVNTHALVDAIREALQIRSSPSVKP